MMPLFIASMAISLRSVNRHNTTACNKSVVRTSQTLLRPPQLCRAEVFTHVCLFAS